jgi:SAM-dependent methyltransferase
MNNAITDRQFWKHYWTSRPGIVMPIHRSYVFHRLLGSIVSGNSIKTAVEVGGFPGYYAVFLTKYLNVRSTLLDYFVDVDIVTKVLERNGLRAGDVDVIEADLFTYESNKQYDLVLSCGLIEHFEDTEDVVRRHVQLLRNGGTLFVSLPNFTGLNGWVQRTFDVSNYEKHNIKSMNPAELIEICRRLGLQNISCKYYGKFTVWLESALEKPTAIRWFVNVLWFAGKAFTTVVPFDSKALSPYIVLTARKA